MGIPDPGMQAVESRHLQPMRAAPPFPASPHLMVGQAGPRWGWVLGETQVPRKEGAVGRGRMSSQLPAQPRPCCLCRAQLRAPGPAEARCPPPGPAPHSPPSRPEPVLGNARSSQRTLFPRGLRGAPELSRFCSWEGKRKIRGLEHPRLSYLCLSHTLTSRGPQLTAAPSFIVRR